MAFLEPFELLEEHVDDHITLSRFNYLNGQFPTDKDGKIISQLTRQLNLDAIPKSFALHQAYPNPFNPATTIEFDLPEDTYVLLEVYDISGRLVKELYNNTKQAGYHSITWNATMYSSGIYFVKLHAGKFHSTQKLMLVK